MTEARCTYLGMLQHAAHTKGAMTCLPYERIEVWDKVGASHYHCGTRASGLERQGAEITVGARCYDRRCEERPTRTHALSCNKVGQQNAVIHTTLLMHRFLLPTLRDCHVVPRREG